MDAPEDTVEREVMQDARAEPYRSGVPSDEDPQGWHRGCGLARTRRTRRAGTPTKGARNADTPTRKRHSQSTCSLSAYGLRSDGALQKWDALQKRNADTHFTAAARMRRRGMALPCGTRLDTALTADD